MVVRRAPPKKLAPPVDIVAVELLPAIIAALVWGRSGTGKTTIAATFPAPLLLLDIREKGTDSVSNVKGLKVAKIDHWKQFEEMYWYLKNSTDHGFKTVAVDQVTALQTLALRQSLKDNSKEETDAPSKRDFGGAAGLMNTWLLNYRDLIDDGINVVFLAHDRLSRGGDDADSGSGEDQIEPEVGPRVMPSVAGSLNGMVKIIGNTFIRETFEIVNKRKVRSVKYCMRIGPHAYFVTKVRSPVGIGAPDSIVDPSYEKMLAIMKGTYSENASNVRKRK